MCILCGRGPFSFVRLAEHIQNNHGHFLDHQLKMLREGGRQNSIQFKAEDCPFCDEWAESLSSTTSPIGEAVDPTQGLFVTHTQFKEHVAIHQEQLAILALRQVTGNREISSLNVDNISTSAAIFEPPLDMDKSPTGKTIDEPHGDSLPNTGISANDELNKTISAAKSVDKIGVPEQPIVGLVSKYDGKIKSDFVLEINQSGVRA